ncbi:hypothetical protein ACFT5B_08830 [Luteimicrobium sp. NPDC057192]|uniref:hypothetical protein n=1 Tax=Luteimicrobium sp. NPDC057192 TaxID=3346042 RepID=UPI00362F5D0E
MENDATGAPRSESPRSEPSPAHAHADADAARAALDAVAESKALVAERMRRGPRWYNPVYGALCGLLILSMGLPEVWFVVGVVVSAIGLGALAGIYRKRTGIVLGTGNPRPRGIYPWLIAVLGVAAVASYFDGHHGFPLGVPIVAVCAGVACWVLSRRYDAALFELLEGQHDDEVRR